MLGSQSVPDIIGLANPAFNAAGVTVSNKASTPELTPASVSFPLSFPAARAADYPSAADAGAVAIFPAVCSISDGPQVQSFRNV